jgi:hypothetical protein
LEALKIIVLSILAAIVYGVCQDMITTRVCLEYFTVGHLPIFGGTQNPTLLALGWGVLATWWVGLGLGIPAAFLARIGSKPKLAWQRLRWPIGILMVVMAICSTAAGLLGYSVAGAFNYYGRVPDPSHEFVADAFAHEMAYTVGFLGGVVTWGWIWWKRSSLERHVPNKN